MFEWNNIQYSPIRNIRETKIVESLLEESTGGWTSSYAQCLHDNSFKRNVLGKIPGKAKNQEESFWIK